MRVAIISGTLRKNSAYKIEQGLGALAPEDNFRKLQYSDLVVSIDKGEFEVRSIADDVALTAYDVVYLHGASNEALRYSIARYCEKHAIVCINSESRHTQYINKLVQYLRFTEAGLPIPPTYGGHKDTLVVLCQQQPIAFPVVVKAAEGSNGDDNFICHNVKDLEQCAPDHLYVLQPFIDNTHDLRVIVAGDEVIYAYKRARDGNETHLNNVSAGGKRDMVLQLSDAHEQIAIKASKAVEREISGVDILVSLDGAPYVLESNFNFGLPELETIDNRFFEQLHAYMKSLARKTEV